MSRIFGHTHAGAHPVIVNRISRNQFQGDHTSPHIEVIVFFIVKWWAGSNLRGHFLERHL
jgi:hypothetical protein